PVINPDTGEIRRVAIFVAVMGASNYTYVEACEGQEMMSWLNAHSRCLTFQGGVPKLLIPDNLRSAVKKTDRYEPVINNSYQCQRQDYWPFWGCGRFPGLLYHSSPHCWRYILGLTAPSDNFIRRSLYHLM
ncbi:tnp domain protein, partial [Escherichia coli P0298942.6]